MLLVLHDPRSERSFWTDARQALRAPSGKERAYIEVPSANNLDATSAVTLFENAGIQDQLFISDIVDVLSKLIDTRSGETTFPLSYFDLFSHGLTGICRTIYYGMDVITNAVEFNLRVEKADFGMGIGQPEHEFTFGFVKFLVAQNLAHVDYADCLIDWIDREMQPHFVAPLTSRGRELVALIDKEEDRLVASRALLSEKGLRVAQEGIFEMVPLSYVRRFARIRAFQETIKAEIGKNSKA